MAIPGNNSLLGGNINAGYFGTVPASELITGDALASSVGISAGVSQHSDTEWLKFVYEGKVQFVSMKPIRHTISWNNINSADVVYGNKTVVVNGETYKVRLIKGTLTDPSDESTADRGSIGSEWNKLMLPIHIEAPNNWAYPKHVDITEDWGIDFTDADLLTSRDYGNGGATWCQENQESIGNSRITRGYSGVTFLNPGRSSNAYSYYGWRPVLESLEAWVPYMPPNLKANINGQLKEYDRGWVNINGQLREIDKMWAKVNNALREV